MLDANPQIAAAHRTSPFLPVGMLIRVPIDNALMMGKPPVYGSENFWTGKMGYTL